MSESIDGTPTSQEVDVLICGGGLAGLTLALQLRQELPALRVVVVEKTSRPLPRATFKVGESSQELGSSYLERLGLRGYLRQRHLVKFALRYFPGGGQLPPDQRLEIGPTNEPTLSAYQLDRGLLESDLRDKVVEAGVTLLEGARVREVQPGPGEAPHRVRIRREGEAIELEARWLVDATGRGALLRRTLRLRRGTGHHASAGWFRLSGRLDINAMVPNPDSEFRRRPIAADRWRSTTHFMGDGYWIWLINLADDRASLGIVAHAERFDFARLRSLEACRAFLAEQEPHLAALLEAHLAAGHEVLDFLCLKNYSHDVARSWSPDRWAVVGEAGAFTDPLYSPGTDFIALANSMTVELIRGDQAGADLEARCAELDRDYRALITSALEQVRLAGPVYGHPRAMLLKIYWDDFQFWSLHCQYFLQRIYALEGEALSPFVEVRERFFDLARRVQALLRSWALLAPEAPRAGFVGLPSYPSLLLETHLAMQQRLSPEETLAGMRGRLAQAEEMVGEMLLRVLAELGPEAGRALLEEAGLLGWTPRLPPDRLQAEVLEGRARSRALSLVARDMDRLFPVRAHPQAGAAMRLVLGE
ncbi:MAG: tryptophan 7-halogenase [Alphaproteobacteria bacterium]|nr:tryptophan 7-halogenase [Alphaproteobacteria bacterium]